MKFRSGVCLFFLLILSSSPLFAQITGPEQDCFNAIPVCQDTFTQTKSYQGTGTTEDLADGTSCLENEENNSVWYIFTVTASGTLEFDIAAYGASASDTVDYDFALYNITGTTCSAIRDTSLEVRCNYAFTDSVTGLRAGFSNPVSTSTGPPFCSPLNVSVGETYVLLVDNFSSTTFGYILDFRPSTATIRDTVPPSITSIDTLSCIDSDSLRVSFSEPILCSSLDSDGSDFLVTGPSTVTVTGAYSPTCATGSFTQTAIINLSSPISPGGNYGLSLVQGADNNTVVDNCGNYALTASQPFYVPEKVTAGFTFTKRASCVADTFLFTNTSTTGPNIPYQWDFGDGSTSTSLNPVHVYPVVDTYAVTLIVSSNDCADTFADSNIVVTNSIDVVIAYDPPDPCVGGQVNFRDSSGYTPSAVHLWEFGDGNISGIANPSHVYTFPGNFQIKLKIIDPACPADSAFENVLVRENIAAAFTSNSPVCAGTTVDFTDASTGAPSLWTWTFHDGSTSNSQNTSFTFDSTGNYQVQLEVTDSFCGVDLTSQIINVLPLPIFYLGIDTSICLSETIALSASAGANSYSWSTGETTQSIVFGTVPDTVRATAFLAGCEFTDAIFIDERIDGCAYALVPSGFSPNADGKNDRLNVKTKRVLEYEIIIYNRWGEEVYRGTNNDVSGWDGTYKDEQLDMGVFSYIITWQPLSGGTKVNSGTITLVR